MASFGRVRRVQAGGNAFARPFTLLLAVSLALLLLRDTVVVRGASSFATDLLTPIERVLGQAGSAVGHVWQAIAAIETLRADNDALRAENERLTLENVQLREQTFAAQQAAGLAAVARSLGYQSQSAPVIARDPSGVLHTIVLGAGTNDGVAVDDIVVSQQGVVGRVSQVGSNFSKVLLITDSGSAVSAIVQGSRAAGIVRGQFGDTLVMDWILQTEDVKAGDLVITAGLAIGEGVRSLFPKGLVLGRVVEVTKGENGTFRRAILMPSVDLRHLENVLVVRVRT